jgi:hypothetical protein
MKREFNKEQTKIIEHLIESCTVGKRFFKSKHIAEDISMSPKCVGANMSILSKNCNNLVIRPWGYSYGTTWMVELAQG